MKAFYFGTVLGSFSLLVSLRPYLPPTPGLGSHKTPSSLESIAKEEGRKSSLLSLPENFLFAPLVTHQQASKCARVSELHFLVKKGKTL